MASITIASITISNWQRDSDVELRIYALDSFVAADNSLVIQGDPSLDQVAASTFYARVACTLSGSALTIAACALESTVDSLDNPSAAYGAYFYTTEGEQIAPFGKLARFVLQATPTSTTWTAIEQAQGTL